MSLRRQVSWLLGNTFEGLLPRQFSLLWRMQTQEVKLYSRWEQPCIYPSFCSPSVHLHVNPLFPHVLFNSSTDCPYGDRKNCILYNCLNPGNWKDCCFTCSPQNGYIHGVTQVNISDEEREHYKKISEEAAANSTTQKPTTVITATTSTTTVRPRNYGNPWKRYTIRRYRIRTRPTTATTRQIISTSLPTTTALPTTTKNRTVFKRIRTRPTRATTRRLSATLPTRTAPRRTILPTRRPFRRTTKYRRWYRYSRKPTQSTTRRTVLITEPTSTAASAVTTFPNKKGMYCNYRPQGKVMFSETFVCPWGGGGKGDLPLDRDPSLDRDHFLPCSPLDRDPHPPNSGGHYARAWIQFDHMITI